MKKMLLTALLCMNMTLNSLAGPLDLNLNLTGGRVLHYGARGRIKSGIKKIQTIRGYNIITYGSKINTGEDATRNLEFLISDNNTEVYLCDKGCDGLNKRDSLFLSHNFKDGERLSLSVEYLGNNNFQIDSYIRNQETNISESHIDTSKLNPAMKYLVKTKLKPVVRWGEQLYSDLVSNIEKDIEPELPCGDLKRALNEVEKILPGIKEGKKDSEDALLKLSNEYLNLIKGQSKS